MRTLRAVESEKDMSLSFNTMNDLSASQPDKRDFAPRFVVVVTGSVTRDWLCDVRLPEKPNKEQIVYTARLTPEIINRSGTVRRRARHGHYHTQAKPQHGH